MLQSYSLSSSHSTTISREKLAYFVFFLFLPSFRSMSTKKNNSTSTFVKVELMIYCIVVYRPKAYMSLLHELNHVVTSWFCRWCFVRITEGDAVKKLNTA